MTMKAMSAQEFVDLIEGICDERVAAERRATVERIRPRIARAFSSHAFEHESDESERGLVDFIRDAMLAILDEEAARDTQLSQPDGKVRP